MSNDQPPRRPAAKAGGGAPMGSTISIVLAIIVVAGGFLILRNIRSDGDSGSAGAPDDTTLDSVDTGATNPGGDSSSSSSVLDAGPPTTPPLNFDQAVQVNVANASGIQGAAGRYSKALMILGWKTGEAVTAPNKVELSAVYFLPGGEAVAASVAQAMTTPEAIITAAAMPTPPPVEGGVIPAGALVLVVLGPDRADKAVPIAAGTTESSLPSAPLSSTVTPTSAG